MLFFLQSFFDALYCFIVANIYLGLKLYSASNEAFVLYYIAIAAMAIVLVICELLLMFAPNSHLQLHLVVLLTSALAGCVAALIAVLTNGI